MSLLCVVAVSPIQLVERNHGKSPTDHLVSKPPMRHHTIERNSAHMPQARHFTVLGLHNRSDLRMNKNAHTSIFETDDLSSVH